MSQQNTPTVLDGMYRGLLGTAIRRPRHGRWLGGVAAGLAARFNMDPVLVRVILFVLGIFFGLGVALYLLAWVLLPDEDDSIVLDRALRQHQAGAVVLTVLAAITLLAPSGVGQRGGWSVSVLAIAAVFAIWYVSRGGRPIGTAAPSPMASGAASPGPSSGPMAFAATGPAADSTVSMSSEMRSGPGSAGLNGPTPPDRPTPPGWHPVATEPTQTRRHSGGLPLAIVALGLSLITYQAVRLAASAANLSGDHETLAWAGVIAVLGLIVVGAAIAGWRLGLVGIGAAILAVLTALGLAGSLSVGLGGRNVGSQSWAPASVADLRSQYSVTFGDGRLDLTTIPVNLLDGRTVTVKSEFGDLEVIVPNDATVTIKPEVRFGNLQWEDTTGATRELSGSSNDATPIVVGTGRSSMILNATVGFGNLDIKRK
ncbi:MAG TPA: PspC domain-containing protein [Dermatophilaceae bacterium]|nr:PspC domain-containing protein [Dermatophilaceae bacterium]